MPFPSTRVFHPRWAEHHQPTTEDAMNSTITITFGTTGGGWVPGAGASPSTPVVTYQGPARVTYEPTQGLDTEGALQNITLRRVTVALPRDAAAQSKGAVVLVDAVDANAPAWLVGRQLAVKSLGRSSHAWEQLLDCLDDLSNQDPT